VGSYVMCSSLALVANKVVMTFLDIPGSVFCLQIFVTVAFILFGAAAGCIAVTQDEILSMTNVKIFAPYMCSFVLSLYSNGKALSVSNMETVIVFRACSPLFVSVLDYLFLGRELPNPRSLVALLGVVAGAVAYVLADGDFMVRGIAAYNWVCINLAGIVFEMTYGKYLLKSVTFSSPVWGATLYTNMLALVPMTIVAISMGEPDKISKLEPSSQAKVWLVMSCIVGVGISWSGWNARNYVSATVYTLLGVVCKFISVVLNILIWDKHATPRGLLALGVCLVSSAMYRQAPMREGHADQKMQAAAKEGEYAEGAEGSNLLGDMDEDEETGESLSLEMVSPLSRALSPEMSSLQVKSRSPNVRHAVGAAGVRATALGAAHGGKL